MIKKLRFALAASVMLGASVASLPAAAAPFAAVPAARAALVEDGAVTQARFHTRRSGRRGTFRANRGQRSSRGFRGAGFAQDRAFSHPLFGRFPTNGRSVLFNSR